MPRSSRTKAQQRRGRALRTICWRRSSHLPSGADAERFFARGEPPKSATLLRMKKVLIGLVVLLALGAAGFGVWWFFIDAEWRNLSQLSSSDPETADDAWAWVASHGDRPVVRELISSDLHLYLGSASNGNPHDEWSDRRLERLTAVFKQAPITDDKLAVQAMIIWARFDFPPSVHLTATSVQDTRHFVCITQDPEV